MMRPSPVAIAAALSVASVSLTTTCAFTVPSSLSLSPSATFVGTHRSWSALRASTRFHGSDNGSGGDDNGTIGSCDPLEIAQTLSPSSPSSSLSSLSSPLPPSRSTSQAGTAAAAAAAVAAWSSFITPEVAAAAGPDWGIFEGRTGSLLHPVAMGCMFLLCLSTGFLGLQWRRQRELGEEISALKKTLPDLGGFGSAKDAWNAAVAEETVDNDRVALLKAAIPVESKIAELAEERKDLSSKGLRDKHFTQGAVMAFVGTAFAIEGPLNTYARAGKLFPGPHLYAGAACVVLWSLAFSCVPFMSKGNETARNVHIIANTISTGLFGWQVLTGWPILLKVVELTKWP